MAIPVQSFQVDTTQQRNPIMEALSTYQNMKAKNLANQLAQLKNQQEPQMFQQQLQQAQTQNQFLPQQMQSKLDLTNAQAKRQEALANLPYGGQILPGAAGQVEALNILKARDPQAYQQALQNYNTQQKLAQARAQYFGANSQLKYLTPEQKLQIGIKQAQDAGNNQLANQLAQSLQKRVTDSSVREKTLYANNIHKTINSIDMNAITPYAGPEGQLMLKRDQALALAGKAPDSYTKYNNFVNVQVPLLTSQVRSFYKDSLSPKLREELQNISNPIRWMSNPNLAMQQFKQFLSILNKETGTYAQALNAPIQAYQGDNNQSQGTINLTFDPSTGGFK